jgi:hypothetical protein
MMEPQWLASSEGRGGEAKIFLVVNRKTIIFAEKSDDAGGHQEGIG